MSEPLFRVGDRVFFSVNPYLGWESPRVIARCGVISHVTTVLGKHVYFVDWTFEDGHGTTGTGDWTEDELIFLNGLEVILREVPE